MADCQVTCIAKSNAPSSHEHITHIGNPSAGWVWTREAVIRSIETNANSFFVVDPVIGTRSTVGVVRPPGRSPYLRTYADGDWNDNLLSLNQCPIR